MVDHGGGAKALQADGNGQGVGTVAVDGKEGQRVTLVVMHPRDIQIGHVVGHIGVIAGAFDRQLQGGAPTIDRGKVIGIVDGLPPRRTLGVGHDGCYHVDQLRDAGDLDHVRLADKGVQDAADLQHILKIIDVLQQARRVRPALVAIQNGAVLLVGMVPDVPFVKADIDVAGRAFVGFDQIDRAFDGRDIAVKLVVQRQIVRGVLGAVGEIHVQADVVHRLVSVLQHDPLPFRVGFHVGIGRAADDQFQLFVERAQGLGDLVRQTAIFIGGLVADLPGAVHLVPQTPQVDVERCGAAVLLAQVAPIAAQRPVDIFDEIARLIQTARAQVDRQHHLGADGIAPVAEFMHADGVAVRRVPGKVQPGWPLVARTDAILPVIGRNKVAAGIAHIGDVQVAHQLRHIAPHPVLVGGRVIRLVNAGINRPAQMFQKSRIDAGVYSGNGEIPVGSDLSLHHGLPSANDIRIWRYVSGMMETRSSGNLGSLRFA